MSFSEKLIEITDASRRRLEGLPAAQDMLQGRYSEERYIQFLKDLYPIVENFCPTMAAAASRCTGDDEELAEYLYCHIHEEQGHGRMVLADLASFDVLASGVVNATPSPAVQSMTGFNYYQVDRRHPTAVLGMMYVLEVISSVYGGQVAQAIAASLQRPLSEGFSFLDSHSAMDMDHMAKLRKLLQSIQSEQAQQVLLESVKMNFYLIAQVMFH